VRSGGPASSRYTCRLCMGSACLASASTEDTGRRVRSDRVRRADSYPRRRMQEAEHDTEERVHRRFVGEDTRARHEWRPRLASPIGMDPIDNGHRRPQDKILKLRGYETLPPASSAHPAEDCSEECAVREMHDDADPAPGPTGGQQRAEEADVRVRRSEDSLTDWLGRYPDGCSHRSRHCPSNHVETIRSPTRRHRGGLENTEDDL